MKTEGAFNAFLSKELKRFAPKVHVLKVADKFSVGISDFLIWCNGKSMGGESKLIQELPARATTKIFSHPFSGAQKTFLESMTLTHNMGFGIVAIASEKKFYVIEHTDIPDGGNFLKIEWDKTPKTAFGFDEVERFVIHYFGTPL